MLFGLPATIEAFTAEKAKQCIIGAAASELALQYVFNEAITAFTGQELSLSYPNAFASCGLAILGRCGKRCSFATGAAVGTIDDLKAQYEAQSPKNFEALDYESAIQKGLYLPHQPPWLASSNANQKWY